MATFEKLKADHRKVKSLFSEYESAQKADKKKRLFEQVKEELEQHTYVEERVLYPKLKAKDKLAEDVAEARQEHHVVDVLLGELAKMDIEEEAFDAKMTVLRENVEHHIEEEDEMFKEAQKVLSQGELNALKNELEAADKAPGGNRR